MEQPRGRKGADEGSALRPKMLDDWFGQSCDAQVYLETGVVGRKAQGKEPVHEQAVQYVREQKLL